jgi:hypothetical protein
MKSDYVLRMISPQTRALLLLWAGAGLGLTLAIGTQRRLRSHLSCASAKGDAVLA